MNHVLTEEQQALVEAVRGVLADRCPTSRVRGWIDDDAPYDRELHRELATMGLIGLAVSEDDGGAGATWVELGLVLEQLGRSLAVVPLLATAGLAVPAMQLAGAPEQRNHHLPAWIGGDRVATLATDGVVDQPPAISATAVDAGHVLTGTASTVVDGMVADDLVVVASFDDTLRVFVVDAAAEGVTRRSLDRLDITRGIAVVEFDAAPAELLIGADGSEAVEAILDRASLALSCELLGVSAAAMAMAVDYAGTRVQFGRPIGSFQAVKHLCADMVVEVESSRSAVAAATRTSDPQELSVAASLAKAYCSDAADMCTAANIQVHGGIGFTWEHDAHLYRRRALSNAALFGSASMHRERMAGRLGW